MARTRAPCTSQNTPRMQCLLRQARRVGGDHKRRTLYCSTAALAGDSGLTSAELLAAELLAAEVQYRALALCPRTEPDRARVRVRGDHKRAYARMTLARYAPRVAFAVPPFALSNHLRGSSMATATTRRCGSCASRHTCTLAGAVAFRREVPSVPPAKTVFKRKLPSGLVAFSSPAGRSFFMQAPAARSRRPHLGPRRSPASHRCPAPCAGDAEQRDGAILPAVRAVHHAGGADVLRAGHADDVHERARRRPA